MDHKAQHDTVLSVIGRVRFENNKQSQKKILKSQHLMDTAVVV